MQITENNIVDIKYQQTGAATAVNTLGMREMQAMAYEHRAKRFLLIKAPPASGKSRALMFIALDKLEHQSAADRHQQHPRRTLFQCGHRHSQPDYSAGTECAG